MLSVIKLALYAEYHYAECHYAESGGADETRHLQMPLKRNDWLGK
jgi:hypothetical protein